LEGWKGLGSAFVIACPFGQKIADDYRDYIGNLPPREKSLVHDHDIRFYQDGRDQRAVEISIPMNGIWWKYVLFYDKNDRRVNVVRYATSRYMS